MRTMRETIWYITKVVAAVLLAITTLLGWAGRFFDTRDTLDTVVALGWTWSDLLFAVMSLSFWIVVVGLYSKVRRIEKRHPNLTVLPIAQKGGNFAYLEVYNNGGYVPNCIANVKYVSEVSVHGSKVLKEYLGDSGIALLWGGQSRTENIPNDGVNRRVKLAQLWSGGWRFPIGSQKEYPSGKAFKIDIVLSFEADTTYTKKVSFVLESKYDNGKGKLSIWYWEHWLAAKRCTQEVAYG